MSRRSYRRRRKNDSLAGTPLLVGALASAAAYGQLSQQAITLLISGGLLLAAATFALIMLYNISANSARNTYSSNTFATSLEQKKVGVLHC